MNAIVAVLFSTVLFVFTMPQMIIFLVNKSLCLFIIDLMENNHNKFPEPIVILLKLLVG